MDKARPGHAQPGPRSVGTRYPLAVVFHPGEAGPFHSVWSLRGGAAPGSLLVKALHGHRILDRSCIGIHMLFNFQSRDAILSRTPSALFTLLICLSIICIAS
jgi:hypothetical protein